MAKENPNMEMKTVQNGKGSEKFDSDLTKEEKSNGTSIFV